MRLKKLSKLNGHREANNQNIQIIKSMKITQKIYKKLRSFEC